MAEKKLGMKESETSAKFASFCGTKLIKESIVRKSSVCRVAETLAFEVPINLFHKYFRLFLLLFHPTGHSGSLTIQEETQLKKADLLTGLKLKS